MRGTPETEYPKAFGDRSSSKDAGKGATESMINPGQPSAPEKGLILSHRGPALGCRLFPSRRSPTTLGQAASRAPMA